MATRSVWSKVKDELGLVALKNAPRDTIILLLTRSFRMFAFGSSTLILALYFSALGHTDFQIGLFMTLTLVGDVVISLALTFVADALGRRRVLLLGSLLMVAAGAVFASTSSYWLLLIAAVVGVVSPSGNEIGPFRSVEESTLAHLTPDTDRSDIFAWYVVVGTLGTSAGSLVCGWMVQRLKDLGWDQTAAFRSVFWIYAVIGLIKSALTLLLSPRCEAQPAPAREEATGVDGEEEEVESFLPQEPGSSTVPAKTPTKPSSRATSKWKLAQISPSSRATLYKLCGLFSIDSLASGMAPTSLISYYISKKFDTPESTLGIIVSVASFTSSIGNIFSSSLAKRIGFIHTMIFTHLPSAVFLILLPAPHSLALTIFFLVARASIASMDQAPRSAFLSAIVLPHERTAVMGVVNTVKTTSQSAGPLITGVLAAGGNFGLAFVAAGCLKAGYDLGLLYVFSKSKGQKNADQQRDAVRAVEAEADADADADGDQGIEMPESRDRARV